MSEYKTIGAPIKPNALTRKGKLINFWLSPRDQQRLEAIQDNMGMTKADVLRFLINNAFLDDQEFQNAHYRLSENEDFR